MNAYEQHLQEAPEAAAKIAELEERRLRAVAELDNLRKRIARDAETWQLRPAVVVVAKKAA